MISNDKQFFGDFFNFCFEGKAAIDSLLQSLFLVLPSESWGSLCPKMPAGRITKIPSWRNSSGCKVEASGILVYGILTWMFGKRTTRWPDIGKGHDNFQVLLTAPVSLSPENWWLEDFIPLKWSVLGIILYEAWGLKMVFHFGLADESQNYGFSLFAPKRGQGFPSEKKKSPKA